MPHPKNLAVMAADPLSSDPSPPSPAHPSLQTATTSLAAPLEVSYLRTTNNLQVSASQVGCCCDMDPPISPHLSACQECVNDCEDNCDLQLTSQCTDQCVVVPCDEAHHDYPGCVSDAPEVPCDFMCTDGTDCGVLDSFMQCCSDYHPFFTDARVFNDPSSANMSFGWPPLSDPIFQMYQAQTRAQQNMNMNMFYPTESFSSLSAFIPSSSSLMPQLQQIPTPVSISPPSHPVHTETHCSTAELPHSSSSLKCMWGNCNATFNTLNELVGHVNLQHLRIPSSAQPQSTGLGDGGLAQRQADFNSLSCLWGNCQIYPSPSSIPGPSTGNSIDSASEILLNHLMQDHFGLSNRPNSPRATVAPIPQVPYQSLQASDRSPSAVIDTAFETSTLTLPPTPGPEHDCSAPNSHVCCWVDCGQSFASCDALTAHINAAHVGSGKAHYDCYWEGCSRNGDNGFASKQKICRHLQSHTGHRPFQCEICQQNFSEAATLAQHMRRHTQEKPYTCDFPGCGKSFAITGALTIHKRTHNGHKPFKCTYCEKAFAESSNLSKHLRTHTGARPYPCLELGCNKSFARPDQLARHMSVHRKKELKGPPASVAGLEIKSATSRSGM